MTFRNHVTSSQFTEIVKRTIHLRDKGKPYEPDVFLLVETEGKQVKINVLDLPITTNMSESV